MAMQRMRGGKLVDLTLDEERAVQVRQQRAKDWQAENAARFADMADDPTDAEIFDQIIADFDGAPGTSPALQALIDRRKKADQARATVTPRP